MSNNPFTERYKRLRNFELIEILNNPSQYQPLAIETAKEELVSRNLSDEELKMEQEIVSSRFQREANRQRQSIDTRVKEKLSTIKLTQKEPLTPVQIANATAIFISIQFIYTIFRNFTYLEFIVTDAFLDAAAFFSLLTYTLMPVAAWFVFRKKPIGWTLAIIHFSVQAISTVVFFIWEIRDSFREPSIFDSVFPRTPPVYHAVILILYTAILWRLCKPDVRDFFKVGKNALITAFGVSLGFIILSHLLL